MARPVNTGDETTRTSVAPATVAAAGGSVSTAAAALPQSSSVADVANTGTTARPVNTRDETTRTSVALATVADVGGSVSTAAAVLPQSSSVAGTSCTHCGVDLPGGAKFCCECGMQQQGVRAQQASD